MRHHVLATLGAGAIVAAATVSAQALPVASLDLAPAPGIERVVGGDGCGPNGIRGRSGYCRPFRGGYGGPRYGYGGPRYGYGGGPRYGYGGGPRYYGGGPRYYAPPRPGIYLGF